ncbi:hypothetical protein [Clostridium sp.]|uniref:hypothetical protein n=1 Tax=Clostridium sp. TaxID=1506 RepID=UPI00257F5ABD|nr:hypothetical protein [Clostridium sp.]
MDRIKSSEKIQKQLWGDRNSELMTSDSEFYEIMKRFIYGEVWQHGNLEPKILTSRDKRNFIPMCSLCGIFKSSKCNCCYKSNI